MKKALLFAAVLLWAASAGFAGGGKQSSAPSGTGSGALAPVDLIWYMPNTIQPDMKLVNDAFNVIL
jgi:hypothetical protein